MSRRVIRKLPTVAECSFEEQLWPVHVGLFVLGGFWAGIVVSVCRFDAAHWVRHPGPWLMFVAIVVAGLMLLANRIPRRYMRRGVMLAIVLSLAMNSAFLIGMAWTNVFGIPSIDQRQLTKRNPQTNEVVIPEYVMQPIKNQQSNQRDVERPEDLGSADAIATDISRQDINNAERGDTPSTTSENNPSVTVVNAQPFAPREIIESAPRSGESPSILSRRVVVQPQPGSQRAQTIRAASATVEQSQPSPADTTIAQSARLTTEEKPAATAAQIPTEQPLPSKLARRKNEVSDAVDAVPDAPRFDRRMREPTRVPQTDLAAKVDTKPATSKQTSEDAIEPRNTELDRTLTAVAENNRDRPSQEFRPKMRTPESRNTSVAEQARDVAATLQPVRERRTAVTSKPTINTLAENTQETATATPTERLAALPTNEIDRQRTQFADVHRRTVPHPEPALSANDQLAVIERPESDVEQPAMFDRTQQQTNPTRTALAAPVATSQVAQSSPAIATNETSTSDPTAEPARTALTKATDGISGIGNAPNLARGANAAVGQADLASAFARRETETQTDAHALDMSSSQPTRQRSTVTGQSAPSTAVNAHQIATASPQGSEVTVEVSASAAATIQKTMASTELAAITSARGETQVDLGPQRVVRMDQVGRAGGGGQPNENVETQSRLMTRSRIGGVHQIAIQAELAAQVASLPDSGGQQPTTLEANPNASSVVQTATGGAEHVSRGRSSSVDIGAPSSATTGEIGVTQASRADSIEAQLADPTAGGGERRRKLASQSTFVADSIAEIPSIAAADDSAGEENGANLTASGEDISPVANGELEKPKDSNVGALASRQPSSGVGMTPELSIASARAAASPTDIDGDIMGAEQHNMRSPRKSVVTPLAAATATATVLPVVAEQGSMSDSDVAVDLTSMPQNGTDELGSVTRAEPGATAFERDAEIGVGGASDQLVANAGFVMPRAQSRSEQLVLQDARFIRQDIGAPPTTVARVAVAVDAFRQRLQRRGSSEQGGGAALPPKTEEAIELGLVYLSRRQQADGRWRLSNNANDAQPGPHPSLRSDTAATGLSLLSFLGAGYHHIDDKYATNVREGLDYLIENQSDEGNLYIRDDEVSAASVGLYSHGIAALALCEAYGMTQDAWLKEPAQKSLDYIVAAQNKRLGGWRYTPGIESDTSVSGWMIMALKSGELAQLNVHADVYANTAKWLDRAQSSPTQRHIYVYNPLAPDTKAQRHGRQPTHVMTAVGLLTRMYLGWRRDNEWMQQGGDYLADNLPHMGASGSEQRDTYYWYYATQVMFHLGGDHWQKWNNQLHPLLVQEQIQQGPLAGSWNPYAPVPDRWAIHAGRLYVTTLNLLSLEVYYRHLPIYAETAR